MAFGVVDAVCGDATGLEVLEDVVVLFFRQVVVVVCASPAIETRLSRMVMMVLLVIMVYFAEILRMTNAPCTSPSMKSKVVGMVSVCIS